LRVVSRRGFGINIVCVCERERASERDYTYIYTCEYISRGGLPMMRGTTTAGPRRRRCYRTAPIQQQPRHAHSELGLHQKCACWQHAARRAPASQSLARADAPRSPRANMTDTHTHATLELHTDRIGQAGGPQAPPKGA